MNRGENDAKTISFRWVPLVYPVRWAESPEEVPEWDVSRGCPWHKWRPKDEKAYEYGITVDFQNNRAWREHNPEWAKPDWDVKPPPAEGYPRLVRCSLKDRVRPFSRTHEDVLGELLQLHKYINFWRAGKPVKKLRDGVLRLAEKYGAPNSKHEGNTLEAWLWLIAYVHTHYDALRLLQAEGYEITKHELQERYTRLNRRAREVDVEATRRHTPKRLVGLEGLLEIPSTVYKKLSEADDGERFALMHLVGAIKDTEKKRKKSTERVVNSTTAFRLEVASYLYNSGFGHSIGRKDEYVTFSEFGVHVRCSVSRWIKYKLSEVWRHGAGVRVCEVCGTLFAPTRRGVLYCKSGTCADKRYREKRAAPHTPKTL